MPSKKAIVVVALLALIIGLVARLPAQFIIDRIAPDPGMATAVSGTVWSGRISALQINDVRISPVNWSLHPGALLRGRFEAEVEAASPTLSFAGVVAATPGGTISASDAALTAELASLTTRSPIGPVLGNLNATIERVIIEDEWPTELVGEFDLDGLTYPAIGNYALGNYRLVCPASGQTEIVCALNDNGGPLEMDGQLKLMADKFYSLSGTVRARPGAPPDLLNGLQFLGRPDSEGRYLIEQEGQLN